MCSYNQVNNSYACQNSYLMNHILKNELGFQGFIMSDWSAQHSGVSSALAGMDMTMPGDVGFDSGTSYWVSRVYYGSGCKITYAFTGPELDHRRA